MHNLSLALVLSVVAGIAQIGTGLLLLVKKALRSHPRRVIQVGITSLAMWLLASGAAECVVSGLDLLRNLTGLPEVQVIQLWKTRADTLLFVVSIGVAAAFILYLVVVRLAGRRGVTR